MKNAGSIDTLLSINDLQHGLTRGQIYALLAAGLLAPAAALTLLGGDMVCSNVVPGYKRYVRTPALNGIKNTCSALSTLVVLPLRIVAQIGGKVGSLVSSKHAATVPTVNSTEHAKEQPVEAKKTTGK